MATETRAASAVSLKTQVPGPRSRALMARRDAAVPRGPAHATPIFVASAHGATVEDVDGNRLIDFAGGIGCLNVGHTNDAVSAAAAAQAKKLTHSAFAVMPYESYVTLAERLNAKVPGAFAKKTLFVNSGAEAVENAVKIARVATGRPAIVAAEDAFHGRTLLTMSLTSKVHPYKTGFGPFAPEIYRMPFPYAYRSALGAAAKDPTQACMDALEDMWKRHVEADKVAAIIVEPVLGEGGFVVPPPDYFGRLRELTTKHGMLLIVDEVQTGFGRTGKLFAIEHSGVVPDILISAKSIAGGFPLAAVTGRAEIMDAAIVGGLGGTYGGNPVSLAAALAVMDQFEDGALLRRANEIGAIVKARGEAWKAKHALVGEVRGIGAMWGIEFVTDRATKAPAKEQTAAIAKHCYEHGLVTVTAGTLGNVVRTLMPLVISDAELNEGLDILGAAIASASA